MTRTIDRLITLAGMLVGNYMKGFALAAGAIQAWEWLK